jgi:hypothetical protein
MAPSSQSVEPPQNPGRFTDAEEQKVHDLLFEIVDDFKHSYVKVSP